MLNESTIEKLNEMRLKGMASAFRDQINNPSLYSLSFEERFGIIVDKQYNINPTTNYCVSWQLFNCRINCRKKQYSE